MNIYFLLYILIGIPVFTYLFVVITRRHVNIDVGAFYGMTMVSCIPFLREIVLIFLIINMPSWSANTVLFKKKP